MDHEPVLFKAMPPVAKRNPPPMPRTTESPSGPASVSSTRNTSRGILSRRSKDARSLLAVSATDNLFNGPPRDIEPSAATKSRRKRSLKDFIRRGKPRNPLEVLSVGPKQVPAGALLFSSQSDSYGASIGSVVPRHPQGRAFFQEAQAEINKAREVREDMPWTMLKQKGASAVAGAASPMLSSSGGTPGLLSQSVVSSEWSLPATPGQSWLDTPDLAQGPSTCSCTFPCLFLFAVFLLEPRLVDHPAAAAAASSRKTYSVYDENLGVSSLPQLVMSAPSGGGLVRDSDEDDNCPVCLESLALRLAGEKPHIQPICGHKLREWPF